MPGVSERMRADLPDAAVGEGRKHADILQNVQNLLQHQDLLEL